MKWTIGEEGSGVWVKMGWLHAKDATEGILAVCKQLDQVTVCLLLFNIHLLSQKTTVFQVGACPSRTFQ